MFVLKGKKMNKDFLQALATLQDNINTVIKKEDNPYFKSKYADLNAIFAEVKTKIRENGFILIQTVQHNYLHTELVHIETGDKLESDMDLLTVKADMQQLGSAVTYARRYSLLPLLNIETEDDDGNLASGKAKSFDEMESLDDFINAIKSAKSVKALGALYYKWSAKFAEGSDEYRKLQNLSSAVKLQLQNPDCKVEITEKR